MVARVQGGPVFPILSASMADLVEEDGVLTLMRILGLPEW